LSEFVDGDLAPEARAEIDAHLSGCATCAGLRRDLERLHAAAASLGPVAPPDHVWLEIAGQLHAAERPTQTAGAPAPSRLAPVWQWAGLAAALVAITAGAYFVTRPSESAVSTSASSGRGNAGPPGSVEAVESELTLAEQHYDKAIAQLEAITKSNDSSLDPSTAATLQKNLTTIDQAILESRAALHEHPESVPARDTLFEALRRKVGVLEATVVLMNEMRKGDQEGAARAAAGITKKS
jgi:hypothetical protein